MSNSIQGYEATVKVRDREIARLNEQLTKLQTRVKDLVRENADLKAENERLIERLRDADSMSKTALDIAKKRPR